LTVPGTVAASATTSPTPTPTSTPTPSPSSSTSYNVKDSTFSLTISPTRLVLTPAESNQTQEISVINQGGTATQVDVQKRDFTGGTDGSLVFQPSSDYSASEWVTVEPASFLLAPGASQTVRATMTVPPNSDVGDHQVALVFLVPAGESSANVKINRGVATPVYVTVPGKTDDTVRLSNLAAPGFVSGGPVTVTATVTNTGNVHRDFRGDSALRITGTDSASFADFTVVRGSTRDITSTWTPPLFCFCNLSVSISNADGRTETQSLQVVVFPVVPALIVLGALLALIVAILLVRRKIRSARPTGGRRHARA
jgi:hypothetical protein